MDFKANIETRESVEAKAKAAFGFDLSTKLPENKFKER